MTGDGEVDPNNGRLESFEGSAFAGAVGVARVGIRSYFSAQYLFAAQHFASEANRLENDIEGHSAFDRTHRAQVLGAVMSAVAFLEATINELYQDAFDTDGDASGYIEPLSPETRRGMVVLWGLNSFVRRASTREKYQGVLRLGAVPPFDEGANPFQAAQLLIDLRNWFVHFTPQTMYDDETHKLGDALRPRFSPNRLMKGVGNAYFPDHALGAGCATWAVRSAREFADDFSRRLGLTLNYSLTVADSDDGAANR